MHDIPNNPDTPNGTYHTTEYDLAYWCDPVPGDSSDTGEWELANIYIGSLEDGMKRLAAKRRVHPEHPDKVRLVRVQQITTITDLEG